MRRILSFLTAPNARRPVFIVIVLLLYAYSSWPVEAVQDLVIQGDYAYLAAGKDGIRILDLSTPEAPQEVGHFGMGGFAHSAAIFDRYLYVASGGDGLRVLDVSLFDRIREVARIGARGSVEKVVISGSYAFLLDTRTGVRVLSIQQPYQPIELFTLPTRSLITALAVQGQFLFTANAGKGVQVYDLSNPARPELRGEYNLPVAARDLATDGRYIFAASGDQGIIVLDASNPAAIQEAGQYYTRGPAVGIDRFASFAFVSMGDEGVEVFDLANPRSLRSIGSYTGISPVRNSFAAYQRAYLAADLYGMETISYQVRMDPIQVGLTGVPPVILDVEVQGSLAFLAAGDGGLRVLNVANTKLPFQVDAFDTQGYAAHVLVSGDLAFIADQPGGIVAVDISNTSAGLQPVSVMATTYQTNSLVKNGNLIYAAEGAGGLRIIDYRDPYVPVEVSRMFTGGIALDVAVTSDYAYLADGIGGLRIFYTGNPAEPKLQSVLDTPGDARSVFVTESIGPLGRVAYAYIADGSRGLRVVNVSDPRAPVTVSVLEITGFAQDVVVVNDIAYLAMGDQGIAQVDVSNAAAPVYLGHFDTPGEAFSVLVQDNLIYIADHTRGLLILQDAWEPSFMGRLGAFDAPRSVVASYAEDSLAYVTDGALGLWTLDISEPTLIKTMSMEVLPGQTGQVSMTDLNVLMVAAGDAGVHFLDMTNPSRPLWIGTVDTPGTVLGFEPRGFQGYLADGLEGIHIITFVDPTAPAIVSSLNTDGIAFDIAVSGEYAFVADGPGGLLALRVRDLRNPAKVSVMPGLREAHAVEVVGNFAFVAGGVDGLRVINVEHPLTMEEVAHLPVEGRAVDIKIAGSYAFVASDTRGVMIYDITDPYNLQVVGASSEELSAGNLTIYSQNRQSSQPRAFQVLIAAGKDGLRIYDVNEQVSLAKLGHYDTPGTATPEQMLDALFLFVTMQRDEIAPKAVRTYAQLALDMGVFGAASLFIWLFAIGNFVLPIRSRREFALLRKRLVAYLFGEHGPAVRVREGKIIQSREDQKRRGPGVALVDLSSAVVLEPPLMASSGRTNASRGKPKGLSKRSQRSKAGDPASSTISVKGPGIVFTGAYFSGRVHSVADLRPQIRLQLKVNAYTRDSIEVINNVFCVFTLGEPPTIYQVTYDGEPAPENVRMVKMTEKDCPPDDPGGRPGKVKLVNQFVDELDDQDKAEVHRYIQSQARHTLPAKDATDPSAKRDAAPFVCDPERVFAAVYSKALDAATGDVVGWDDLPAKVAVDEYRDILAHYTYDSLYALPNNPDPFPLSQVKFKFARNMKNMGVMSYQYVRRVDDRPMEVNQVIPAGDLVYYPVQKFQTPKVLRVRGIKVISAGFTELRPTHSEVRPQQLDKWSAGWELETEGARAEYELNAMRIRSEARVQSQRNMALNLSELFKGSQFSEEALALRVFQALESAAADPVTRKLLPGDTIAMLRNLQYWLAPDHPLPQMPKEIQNVDEKKESDSQDPEAEP